MRRVNDVACVHFDLAAENNGNRSPERGEVGGIASLGSAEHGFAVIVERSTPADFWKSRSGLWLLFLLGCYRLLYWQPGRGRLRAAHRVHPRMLAMIWRICWGP
jgi:hypothetical protein